MTFFFRLNKHEDVFDSSQDEAFVTPRPLKKATRKTTRPAPDVYDLSDVEVEARPPKPKGKPKAAPTAAKKAKKAASTDESSTSSDSTDKDGVKKKGIHRKCRSRRRGHAGVCRKTW